MPRKMVEVEWSLDDYFSKFGFGDGDNADAKDMGRTYIEQAQQLVNEALEVLKLPYRCEQLEVVTMHNDCRLELLKKDGPKGEELEIDFADDGELQDTDRLPLNMPRTSGLRWRRHTRLSRM